MSVCRRIETPLHSRYLERLARGRSGVDVTAGRLQATVRSAEHVLFLRLIPSVYALPAPEVASKTIQKHFERFAGNRNSTPYNTATLVWKIRESAAEGKQARMLAGLAGLTLRTLPFTLFPGLYRVWCRPSGKHVLRRPRHDAPRRNRRRRKRGARHGQPRQCALRETGEHEAARRG